MTRLYFSKVIRMIFILTSLKNYFRNEGVQEGIAKSIMRVINQGKLSYDEIAEGFDVPIDEVRKLAAQMT